MKLKIKDALLRQRHSDRQISVIHSYLTRADAPAGGGIRLATYGGHVNVAPPDAMAAAQRSAVLETRTVSRGSMQATTMRIFFVCANSTPMFSRIQAAFPCRAR